MYVYLEVEGWYERGSLYRNNIDKVNNTHIY